MEQIFKLFFILSITSNFVLAQSTDEDTHCFYCSSQPRSLSPHHQEKEQALFTYHRFNITETCVDICGGLSDQYKDYDYPPFLFLNSQVDCQKAAPESYKDRYSFLFDESVQTCFNFDPRDAMMRPLPNIINKTLHQQRQLFSSVCSENTNCYDCGVNGGLCQWENNNATANGGECKFSSDEGVNQIQGQEWFKYFSQCQDDLGLCNTKTSEAGFEYTMYDIDKQTKIPKNFYCNFTINLKNDLIYGVEIHRSNRYDIEEYIDLTIRVAENGAEKLDYISDQTIRKNSVYTRMSSQSKAELLFRNKYPTTIEFHTINVKREQLFKTFRIVVLEDYDYTLRAMMGYQTMFVSLFCLVLCCSCGAKCLKCIVQKYRSCRRQNRPRGDDDDIGGLQDQRPYEQASRSSDMRASQIILNIAGANRVADTATRLQEQIEYNKKIVAKLTQLTYTKEFAQNDEFNLNECVFCMDPFEEGDKIVQIPMCKHFFHPTCCSEWFKKNVQQSQTRKCPICNQQVTMDLLNQYQ